MQVTSPVRLMPQNQPSGRGLLPSPTAWSPDQHHAAMLADVSRPILGRAWGFRQLPVLTQGDRLGGLVVKASASRAEGPGFESRLRRDFSGSSHTSDFKIGTPVATLPGAWRDRVSAGTGRPGVSIL